MQFSNNSQKYLAQINACINAFYFFLRWNNSDAVYAMLSPNLRRFLSVKKFEEKFKVVFLFGQNVVKCEVFEQKETAPGIVSAIVIIGLKPKGMDEASSAASETDSPTESGETKYYVYRFTFIDIDDYLFIEDAYLDNNYLATTFN